MIFTKMILAGKYLLLGELGPNFTGVESHFRTRPVLAYSTPPISIGLLQYFRPKLQQLEATKPYGPMSQIKVSPNFFELPDGNISFQLDKLVQEMWGYEHLWIYRMDYGVPSVILSILKIYKAVQTEFKKIPFVVSEGEKKMLLTYRGYSACGDIDEKTDLIKGRVIDVSDSITFEGESVSEFKKAFYDAIDSYLEFCEAENRKPDKPFSGVITYRTTGERHRAISIAAAQAGLSINGLIDTIIGGTIDNNNNTIANLSSYAMN